MFIRQNPCSACRLLLRISLSAEQYAVMLGLWTVSNVVDSSNVRTIIFRNWMYLYGFFMCAPFYAWILRSSSVEFREYFIPVFLFM